MKVRNILTVDLEDWYHGLFSMNYRWDGLEDRIERNSRKVLRILSDVNTNATFFILGVVAEKHPGIVREIHGAGHEIGIHGYSHELVYNMSPERFGEDIERSLAIVNGIIGSGVIGYRAPAFSVTEKTPWVFDILRSKGLVYDASIYPVRNPLYGFPGAPRFPHKVEELPEFVEVPSSTVRILGRNIPVGGGFYLRAYPYLLTKRLIQLLNNKQQPAVVYIHPWDFDPDQPRVSRSLRERISHYYNLSACERKFKMVLKDFCFRPVRDLEIVRDRSK